MNNKIEFAKIAFKITSFLLIKASSKNPAVIWCLELVNVEITFKRS